MFIWMVKNLAKRSILDWESWYSLILLIFLCMHLWFFCVSLFFSFFSYVFWAPSHWLELKRFLVLVSIYLAFLKSFHFTGNVHHPNSEITNRLQTFGKRGLIFFFIIYERLKYPTIILKYSFKVFRISKNY